MKETSLCVCVCELECTSFAWDSILKCTENGECWVLWLQKGQGGGRRYSESACQSVLTRELAE